MKPNVVFLVLDSCRADRFYGSKKTSKTPSIDHLIKNGTYFEQAISSSDGTLVACASMFTGKHAFKTGIRSTRFRKLDKDNITYFEILKNFGYHLYGYIPTSTISSGIFPEFENYDDYHGYRPRLFDGWPRCWSQP